MAETNTLTATPRNEFGKGAARRARRAGLIPAVLYGHGEAPQHLSLPSHETFLILKDTHNALIEIELEGTRQLALSKDVQLDPVRRTIEHVDLVAIRQGEKVSVDIPVTVTGESAPGTIHQVELQSLTVTVPATSIPEQIEVSIEGMEDGSVVRVQDLQVPAGVEIEVDDEYPVVVISEPRASAEDLEVDEAAAASGDGEPGSESTVETIEEPSEG